MFDSLLLGNLLFGVALLYVALRVIASGYSCGISETHEASKMPAVPDAYGQRLVNVYLSYRQ